MTKEIDKEMSEQLLRSLGWKMEGFNHSTPFTSHVFYIRDFRYKHQQLFTVAKDDFYSPNIIDNSPIGDYVNFIGQVMKKIAKKKSLTEMDKRGIAPVLINYIKNTQSFKQWRDISEPDERLHCVLNIYHNKAGSKDSIYLRPFIVRPETPIIKSDDFLEYSNAVHRADRLRHPEWFR